jgi:hypothetical protein
MWVAVSAADMDAWAAVQAWACPGLHPLCMHGTNGVSGPLWFLPQQCLVELGHCMYCLMRGPAVLYMYCCQLEVHGSDLRIGQLTC